MSQQCMLVFLTLAISMVRGLNVEVEIIDGGFSLKYKNVEILKHTQSLPLLAIGHGTFEADEHDGNFDLNDHIDELVVLDVWTYELEGDQFIFNLTDKFEEINVVLVISENWDDKLEVQVDYTKSVVQTANRWFLHLPATKDEFIWGGGEQYTYFNLRQGETYPMWVREQGVGRNKSSNLTQMMDLLGAGGDYHTTYWPQASFLSSRGYHVELNVPTYSELQLAPLSSSSSVDHHRLYWHQTPVPDHPCVTCKIVFTVKPTLMQIVQSVNPGQPMLPEWVHQGAILAVQGGTDRMLEVLQFARENEVAVSGLWIQDWSGKITTEFGTRVFWNWKWNNTWYPGLDEVIQQLKLEGVRVTAYMTPHLNILGDIFQDNQDKELWLTDEQGEILKQDFGQFDVATVDIIKTDPDCNCLNPARMWYKQLIKNNLLGLGLSGWMADFGEYTPMNANTEFDGRWWGQDASEILHQILPQHWASLTREAVEEAGQLEDTLFWMRSGGTTSKQSQVMSWAGDQAVDWTRSDGLPSAIVAALSLAVSGMGLSHSDIGGYTSVPELGLVRTKELLLRWAEFSVFTPVMRTHETNRPNDNIQVYTDEDTMRQFGRLTRMFATLSANYTRSAVKQNKDEGIPVMSPLFLHFESDKECFNQDYQYMFGPDLLVAPVIEPSAQDWTVYLPGPEDWIWLWDTNHTPDIVHGPAYVVVGAPLGKPPVFYRASSPWADLFQTIGSQFQV